MTPDHLLGIWSQNNDHLVPGHCVCMKYSLVLSTPCKVKFSGCVLTMAQRHQTWKNLPNRDSLKNGQKLQWGTVAARGIAPGCSPAEPGTWGVTNSHHSQYNHHLINQSIVVCAWRMYPTSLLRRVWHTDSVSSFCVQHPEWQNRVSYVNLHGTLYILLLLADQMHAYPSFTWLCLPRRLFHNTLLRPICTLVCMLRQKIRGHSQNAMMPNCGI